MFRVSRPFSRALAGATFTAACLSAAALLAACAAPTQGASSTGSSALADAAPTVGVLNVGEGAVAAQYPAGVSGLPTAVGEAASPSEARITVEAPATQSDVAEHLPGDVIFVENDKAAQLSYYRLSDGMTMGTASEGFARPALSLIKLYLTAYVLEYGSLEDRYEAIDMITNSSDVSADDLFAKYPESIDAIAEEYHLTSTRAADRWGYSVTSTHDVVSFIVQLLQKDPTHPILVAMSQADKVSADGYAQDYGTATLSNVIGTKWGWSDDRSLHSSVSFGENFVVAAAVTGSAQDLTDFVKNQVTVPNLNAATTRFIQEREGTVPAPTFLLPTTSARPATTMAAASSTRAAAPSAASSTNAPTKTTATTRSRAEDPTEVPVQGPRARNS